MEEYINKWRTILKILYVHGFLGSANGSASKAIKEQFPDAEVYAPSISFENPKKAVDQVRNLARDCDILMASSLGCLFSVEVRNIPKILINFALPKDVCPIYGKRKSNKLLPNKDWYMNELRSITPKETWNENDKNYNLFSDSNTYYIFGEKDEIAHNIKIIDRWIEMEKVHGHFEAMNPCCVYDLPYNFIDGLDINSNIIVVENMGHKFDSSNKKCLEAIKYFVERI